MGKKIRIREEQISNLKWLYSGMLRRVVCYTDRRFRAACCRIKADVRLCQAVVALPTHSHTVLVTSVPLCVTLKMNAWFNRGSLSTGSASSASISHYPISIKNPISPTALWLDCMLHMSVGCVAYAVRRTASSRAAPCCTQ